MITLTDEQSRIISDALRYGERLAYEEVNQRGEADSKYEVKAGITRGRLVAARRIIEAAIFASVMQDASKGGNS